LDPADDLSCGSPVVLEGILERGMLAEGPLGKGAEVPAMGLRLGVRAGPAVQRVVAEQAAAAVSSSAAPAARTALGTRRALATLGGRGSRPTLRSSFGPRGTLPAFCSDGRWPLWSRAFDSRRPCLARSSHRRRFAGRVPAAERRTHRGLRDP